MTSATPLDPVVARPANLTEIVFRRIRDGIVNQSIAPGSRVSESSLATMLQVSKTPVRESLLRLTHVGLVESTDRGLRVVMPDVDKIRHAYELRAGIEAMSSKIATKHATPGQQLQIQRSAESSLAAAQKGDGANFRRSDIAFHTAVAEASDNPLIIRAVGDALVLTGALRARDVHVHGGDSVDCAAQHIAIAAAIGDGDDEQASALMEAHIVKVLGIVLVSMSHTLEGATGP